MTLPRIRRYTVGFEEDPFFAFTSYTVVNVRVFLVYNSIFIAVLGKCLLADFT